MQNSRNNFINNLYFSKKENKNIKGFLSDKNISILKNNAYKGKVLPGWEYRPDKVAAYYLGDERLGWLIDITNGFYNGIKDYYLGREILIPVKESIESLRKI